MLFGGYEFAQIQKHDLHAQINLLNKSIDNLSAEHERLQSQYNMLKVELDIANLTNENGQQASKDAINREQALKEQISFYQRVLSPEMSQEGFVLERMQINATSSENNFLLKMILLQDEDIKAVIRGELKMRIFGSKQGKVVNFDLVDLQDDPKTSLKFGFKYFQVIETGITLPKDFIPERIEISTDIYKYKRKRGDYDTTIKWQDVFIDTE